MIIIGMSNSVRLAKSIAKHAGKTFSELNSKHFPDGESNLRFMKSVKGKHVVLVNSFYPNPNNTLTELYFATRSAKNQGAKKVTIIAPYLGYMRQDKAFHQGEIVSSSYMGELMSCADELITIDPHLHRYKTLNQVIKTKTKRLSANGLIAEYIKKNHSNAIIIGPDSESYQWAEHIAEKLRHHAVVLRKKRYSSTIVRIKLKQDVKWNGKNVVIVDDIISTGHTMIEPIKQLKTKGVKNIYCIGVHGIFVLDAVKKLEKLGAKVICTNTIERKQSKIDVAKLIVANIK